jgi:hypothetical protein
MKNIKELIKEAIIEKMNEEDSNHKIHSMTDMYRHIAGYHHHMNAADDAYNKGHEKKKDNHYKQAENHLNNLYKKHGKYLPPKNTFHHYSHDTHEDASEFVHYAHPKGSSFHETQKSGKKWD